MEIPTNLKYTTDHEWILIEGDTATVGISSFALEQLGDIVHIEFPEVGESFPKGDSFGTVESTKTVSDLYLPVDGTVLEINTALEDSPESLQEDCYTNGWLVKIKVTGSNDELMDASAYEAFIKDQ